MSEACSRWKPSIRHENCKRCGQCRAAHDRRQREADQLAIRIREDRIARPAQYLPILAVSERPDEASEPRGAAVEPPAHSTWVPSAGPDGVRHVKADEVAGIYDSMDIGAAILREMPDVLRTPGAPVTDVARAILAEFDDIVYFDESGEPQFRDEPPVTGENRLAGMGKTGDSIVHLETQIAALNIRRKWLLTRIGRGQQLIERLRAIGETE